MSEMMFNPGYGVEAMKEANEAVAKSGAPFRRVNYLQYPDGVNTLRLRFLTPVSAMPVMLCHSYVPTKPAPAGVDASRWSPTKSAVCRMDRAFRKPDGTPGFPNCYICDAKITNRYGRVIKATPKMWALACLRGPVQQADNSVIIDDLTRDVQIKDGEDYRTVTERAIIVVSQSPQNFWNHAMGHAHRNGGTLSDRDYEVEKQGEGKDVAYMFFDMGKDDVLYPGSRAWETYELEVKNQGLDLGQIICKQASNDYYARFFDPNFVVTDKGLVVPAAGGAQASPAAAAAQKSNAERINEIRGMVRPTAPPAAAPVPAAVASAPATVDGGNMWDDYEPGF